MKFCKLLIVAGLFATGLGAQEPAQTSLFGTLTRRTPTYTDGSTPGETAPNMAADAVVSLCFISGSGQESETTYTEVMTTTSDADGRYAFVIDDDLDLTKTYVLRIRPIDGEWKTVKLGTGLSKAEWAKEFDIELAPWIPSGVQVPQGARDGNGQALRPVKQVIFATDRNVVVKDGWVRVTNDVGADELRFGLCNVVLDYEGTEQQSWWDRLVGRDRDKYFTVDSISPLSADSADKEFTKALLISAKRDSLLFIHGYNTSFNDACRRAAQIAYDTKFLGPIFLYSWASHDRMLEYEGDEERVASSAPLFIPLLRRLLETKGLNHLHLIAHSMGNRILLDALASGKLSAEDRKHLGYVVFAAPDVSRRDFERLNVFSKTSRHRATLYASGKDQALRVSMRVHGSDRAGDSKPEVEIVGGIDSIDATAVDVSLLGHSYIGNSRSVLVDLSEMISHDATPENRVGLARKGNPSKTWWVMTP